MKEDDEMWCYKCIGVMSKEFGCWFAPTLEWEKDMFERDNSFSPSRGCNG